MRLDWFDVGMWVAFAFLCGLTAGLWIVDRRNRKEMRRMSDDLVALRCRAEVDNQVRREMAQHEARR